MGLDNLSVKDLLEAGVHFGHKISRWNPKMSPYIYGKRNMVHLIDVRATIRGLVKAYHFIENLARRGEVVLFVGTKRQIKSVIETEASRCGMPYVSERWPGGLLTNYQTVRSRLNRLLEIERWSKEGVLERFTKKEVSRIRRLERKLRRNLDGIRVMDRAPACVVIVDPAHEHIAVAEANKIGASIVALIDTDGDPDQVDLVIPCNDDSMKVVQGIISKLADAVIEGRTKGLGGIMPGATEAPASNNPAPEPATT